MPARSLGHELGDFIADTCHGMFGFEKPRWHYIPECGALEDALAAVVSHARADTRSRFLAATLAARAAKPARSLVVSDRCQACGL